MEIWLESDRAEQLIQLLSASNAPQFIKYEGRLLNKADLTGVFLAKDIADMKRRKNGEYQCQSGKWHEKFEKCDCLGVEQAQENDLKLQAIRLCGKCYGGWVKTEDAMVMCNCIKKFNCPNCNKGIKSASLPDGGVEMKVCNHE